MNTESVNSEESVPWVLESSVSSIDVLFFIRTFNPYRGILENTQEMTIYKNQSISDENKFRFE